MKSERLREKIYASNPALFMRSFNPSWLSDVKWRKRLKEYKNAPKTPIEMQMVPLADPSITPEVLKILKDECGVRAQYFEVRAMIDLNRPDLAMWLLNETSFSDAELKDLSTEQEQGVYDQIIVRAAELGHKGLVEYFYNRGVEITTAVYEFALVSGSIELLNWLWENEKITEEVDLKSFHLTLAFPS